MKTTKYFLSLFILLLLSCDKNETSPVSGLTDGFCIMINSKTVLNHHDIYYYDFSEHKIYLKNNTSFLEDTMWSNMFTVYADMDSIYSGYIWSSVSSYLPKGPVIYGYPISTKDEISIGCNLITDQFGNTNKDPRNDKRIIYALKKYGQFKL